MTRPSAAKISALLRPVQSIQSKSGLSRTVTSAAFGGRPRRFSAGAAAGPLLRTPLDAGRIDGTPSRRCKLLAGDAASRAVGVP